MMPGVAEGASRGLARPAPPRTAKRRPTSANSGGRSAARLGGPSRAADPLSAGAGVVVVVAAVLRGYGRPGRDLAGGHGDRGGAAPEGDRVPDRDRVAVPARGA